MTSVDTVHGGGCGLCGIVAVPCRSVSSCGIGSAAVRFRATAHHHCLLGCAMVCISSSFLSKRLSWLDRLPGQRVDGVQPIVASGAEASTSTFLFPSGRGPCPVDSVSTTSGGRPPHVCSWNLCTCSMYSKLDRQTRRVARPSRGRRPVHRGGD
jgi:hypothetical protein